MAAHSLSVSLPGRDFHDDAAHTIDLSVFGRAADFGAGGGNRTERNRARGDLLHAVAFELPVGGGDSHAFGVDSRASPDDSFAAFSGGAGSAAGEAGERDSHFDFGSGARAAD